MNDQAGDAACEAVGELPHYGAIPLVQHVDAAFQVHHGHARMGGHELQYMLELVRRISVHFGGRAHLSEAELSEPEKRIVPVDALLEQGVNHDPHAARGSCSAPIGKPSTARGMVLLSRFS